MLQDAVARSANSYEALKQALLAQSKVIEAIEPDAATLQSLMMASSGAVGALQAQQSGNELAGLQVKQALQLQDASAGGAPLAFGSFRPTPSRTGRRATAPSQNFLIAKTR